MSTLVERLHLARALMWVPVTGAVFYFGWQTSVVVVLLYSAYANLAGDLGVWQGRRAERRSLENPPQDKGSS
jgi:hypothetical protein